MDAPHSTPEDEKAKPAKHAASLRIGLKRLTEGEGLPLPTYLTAGSAGADVCAVDGQRSESSDHFSRLRLAGTDAAREPDPQPHERGLVCERRLLDDGFERVADRADVALDGELRELRERDVSDVLDQAGDPARRVVDR
jgi:hypothetical protein